jgi:ferritin-like metal-binding protein YciE
MKYKKNRDIYITWVQNIYALETSLAETYEKRAGGNETLLEIRRKLKQHAKQTADRLPLIQEILESHDEQVSRVKSTIGLITGHVDTVSTKPFAGNLAITIAVDYASEAFEVATFKGLITAAQIVGDTKSIKNYETFLREDQRMAEWLLQNMNHVVAIVYN